MNYQFPTIEKLEQIRGVVEGRKEFTIIQRGPYTVVSYQVVMPDTFSDVHGFHSAARRECRGLIFDKNGKIMRRSYHKFFNMNERTETLVKNIDWNKPHVILEKLDGSMVTPLVFGDNVRWATKLGITGVAMEAEAHVTRNDLQNYVNFAKMSHDMDMTPIFEWCSNKNKIVLDYPEDRLVLTGIRWNVSGEYVTYDWLAEIAKNWNIPVVQKLNVKDLEEVSKMEEIEGVVVRFDDGHMVKIKTEWYLLRHKTKEMASSEKNVLDLVVNMKLDDVKPYLTEVEYARMERFNVDVLNGIEKKVDNLMQFMYDIKNNHSRKDFATLYSDDVPKIDKSIVFKFYETEDVQRADVFDTVMEAIRKNLGSAPRIENVRYLWGGKRWMDY